MFNRSRVGDLENLEESLSSWISEHLGEGPSYMADEVNQFPSLLRENSLKVDPPEVSPRDDSLGPGDHGTIIHSP